MGEFLPAAKRTQVAMVAVSMTKRACPKAPSLPSYASAVQAACFSSFSRLCFLPGRNVRFGTGSIVATWLRPNSFWKAKVGGGKAMAPLSFRFLNADRRQRGCRYYRKRSSQHCFKAQKTSSSELAPKPYLALANKLKDVAARTTTHNVEER